MKSRAATETYRVKPELEGPHATPSASTTGPSSQPAKARTSVRPPVRPNSGGGVAEVPDALSGGTSSPRVAITLQEGSSKAPVEGLIDKALLDLVEKPLRAKGVLGVEDVGPFILHVTRNPARLTPGQATLVAALQHEAYWGSRLEINRVRFDLDDRMRINGVPLCMTPEARALFESRIRPFIAALPPQRWNESPIHISQTDFTKYYRGKDAYVFINTSNNLDSAVVDAHEHFDPTRDERAHVQQLGLDGSYYGDLDFSVPKEVLARIAEQLVAIGSTDDISIDVNGDARRLDRTAVNALLNPLRAKGVLERIDVLRFVDDLARDPRLSEGEALLLAILLEVAHDRDRRGDPNAKSDTLGGLPLLMEDAAKEALIRETARLVAALPPQTWTRDPFSSDPERIGPLDELIARVREAHVFIDAEEGLGAAFFDKATWTFAMIGGSTANMLADLSELRVGTEPGAIPEAIAKRAGVTAGMKRMRG